MKAFCPLLTVLSKTDLWDQPDHITKVFFTMVANQCHDHVYRGTSFELARESKKTEVEVADALDILSFSKSITAHEDGWLLELERYEFLMQQQAKRTRDIRANKAWRAKRKKEGSPA